MLKFLKKLSIKYKLLYIIFSVAGTVLFINFIFTLLINLNSQKQDMFENTQIQAQMISEHCAAPLLFDDYEALKENLGILQKNPDLIHAYIYNEEGVLLAKYHSSGSLKSDFNPLKAISGKFTGNYLLIKEDITYNQTFLGHLYIYASLNSMKISLLKYFMFNMILIVLFLLFAYLLALRLQKSISEPILELASVLRTISQDKDYSLRVKKIRDDEIGILYDGFNDMLNQIHNQQMKRDTAESALLESEEIFNQFMKYSPIYIHIKDSEIRPVRLSENYATLFNKPIEDMIGKSMYNVYPKEIADKIIAEDMDVINNKKSIETEEKVYDRIYTSIKFPIQIDDKATFIAGFSIDITDKRKAEEALRDMEKLESVGTLAGGIAHDFNNLLMGLFGNITLAKHQLSEDHPAVASLEQAEKVMDRATGLSKQLLTFAKGGEPVKETVDISKLIEETVNFDLSGSNVKAHFDIPTELEYAEVDKGQIQQVLSNLVINAKQAMLYGGNLHIQLSNKVLKNGKISNLMTGKYIKISIRDDGKGIDKKDIERIFDPYFSTKKTGSGLGLATCHSIVSKHGGHILVESEMGKGSCFIIYLPASKEKTIKTELQEEETIIPNNSVAKILVMDDDEMILNIVTRSLQIDGYRIETALHGQMAIDMYRDAMEKGEGFDLLILDLTIPGGIGGKETLKEILKIDPNAKAIVSSGYATDPVMANFKDFGFKAVAEKPYRISKFRAIVNKVLVSSV